MLKPIPFFQFAQLLFDSKDLARKAAGLARLYYKTIAPSQTAWEILYARTKISRYPILIRTFVRAYKSA